MTDQENPPEPAEKREDRRDEDFAAAAERLGLYTPLRVPEAYPEGVGDHELDQLDQAAVIEFPRGEPKIWPEDY